MNAEWQQAWEIRKKESAMIGHLMSNGYAVELLFDGSPHYSQITKMIPQIILDLIQRHRAYLAGGAVLSAILDKPINDIDIFFKDRKSRLDFIDDLMRRHYVSLVVTKNAITMVSPSANGIPIQIVSNHYYREPMNCLESFDIRVSQFGLMGMSNGTRLVYNKEAMADIVAKRLTLSNNIYNVGSTLYRISKYSAKYGLRVDYNSVNSYLMAVKSRIKIDEEMGDPYSTQLVNLDMTGPISWKKMRELLSGGHISQNDLHDNFGTFEDWDGCIYSTLAHYISQFKVILETERESYDWYAVKRCSQLCFDLNRSLSNLPIHSIQTSLSPDDIYNSIEDPKDTLKRRYRSSGIVYYSYIAEALRRCDNPSQAYMISLQLLKFLESVFDAIKPELVASAIQDKVIPTPENDLEELV